MLNFIIRRVLYAIPTLIGVLVITWFLFFRTATPEVIARRNLSARAPTQKQIQSWIKDHGYDKPWQEQLRKSTVDMMLFRFGQSDATKEDIKDRIAKGALPSFAIASTSFIGTVIFAIIFAAIAAYFRGTYVDGVTTILCVISMSIVYIVYIIGFQFVFCKLLKLGPTWGFDEDQGIFKYIIIPTVIGVVAGLATEIRLYRTFLLEETNLDYVRTARAKGVPEPLVLLKHVLKNALIPILTNTVAVLPSLIMGSLILESFFGIPGLGNYLVDAINANDFSVVRAMVFLGTLLYIIGLILTDIAYAIVDPRVRLG
ncbi:MAG: ABC transporter permease [Armatimonas sp.]